MQSTDIPDGEATEGRYGRMAVDINALVDADSGLVSRRIFSGEEIYQQELEWIFARCSLFLTDLLTNRIARINTKHYKYA